MADTQQVILHDVKDEYPDVTLEVVVCQDERFSAEDGLIIYTGNHEQRVVIENHGGTLMLHVWATRDSVQNDPTHSIEISEPSKAGFHRHRRRVSVDFNPFSSNFRRKMEELLTPCCKAVAEYTEGVLCCQVCYEEVSHEEMRRATARLLERGRDERNG
jgi:hypothetical protein